jgi:DHA2 family multidrug resistance protein
VVEREKLHAARIGEAVTPFSQALRTRMVEAANVLIGHPVDSHAALQGKAAEPVRQQILALIDRNLHHEALLLAYSDAFLVAGAACCFARRAVCCWGGASRHERMLSSRKQADNRGRACRSSVL